MIEKPKRVYARTLKTYVVEGEDERLVRAYTAADALRHVTPQFRVYPASHDDIISLMAAGTPVETAGVVEPPADEAAPGLTD